MGLSLTIDEDEPGGIEIKLILEPGLAPLQEVRALLLAGVRGLFPWNPLPIEEAPERADAHLQPALVSQAPLHLLQRDVVLLIHQALQEVSLRLDAA